jgi:hypothetical protein
MSLKAILSASVLSAGLAAMAMPANALTMGPSGVCPTTAGHGAFGSGGPGNATDCNLFIDFMANGSISTTAGPQTTFDSIEDSLIGVYNHTGSAIFSFNLAGLGIGGFDGDGIDGYANGGPIVSVAGDTTGYGGVNAFFTNNLGNSLTVNFVNGIAAGGHDFFSLEEPASLSLVVTPAPEPVSMAILGTGLLGLGLVRRRRP